MVERSAGLPDTFYTHFILAKCFFFNDKHHFGPGRVSPILFFRGEGRSTSRSGETLIKTLRGKKFQIWKWKEKKVPSEKSERKKWQSDKSDKSDKWLVTSD